MDNLGAHRVTVRESQHVIDQYGCVDVHDARRSRTSSPCCVCRWVMKMHEESCHPTYKSCPHTSEDGKTEMARYGRVASRLVPGTQGFWATAQLSTRRATRTPLLV